MKTAPRQLAGRHTARSPRPLGAILPALAVTSGFLGCDSPPDAPAVTVSDSAGTRIVTYASLDDEAFPVIDLEARVDTIGTVEGADEYLFRLLFSAELVPPGIVTADLFNSELRLFDRSERFVSGVGGRGEGPGEFQTLTWMRGHGDSLFHAWDQWGNRLNTVRLTEAGLRHESSVQGSWEPGYNPVGVFSPGRVALDNAHTVPIPTSAGLQRFELVVSVMDLDADPSSKPLRHVAAVESALRYVSEDQRLVPVPFQSIPRYFFADGMMWLKDGVNGEFRRVRMDGSLELVVRLPPGRQVTDRDVAAFRERNLRNVPDEEMPAARRRLDEVPSPSFFPSLGLMEVDDASGLVWLTPYPSGDEPVPWYVFDSLGCPVGRVNLPGDDTVLDIAGRRIAVRNQDEMDVERVLIHHLAESPSDRAGSGTSDCRR
ncbi:MAG: hypothetical protein OXU69_08725 [Gemmatimonadota bacterium]|nr:hypothetical protein [Gemmatimonadota bacterium]